MSVPVGGEPFAVLREGLREHRDGADREQLPEFGEFELPDLATEFPQVPQRVQEGRAARSGDARRVEEPVRDADAQSADVRGSGRAARLTGQRVEEEPAVAAC